MVVKLPDADANKVVSLASGNLVIRNLMQDQYTYEPVVAEVVAIHSKAVARKYNTTTEIQAGDQIVVDWRSGKFGVVLERLNDGSRIMVCSDNNIAGYIRDGITFAYGENIFVSSYNQERDYKTASGLFLQEPSKFQHFSEVIGFDTGYRYKFDDIQIDDIVLHYPDTDIEYNIAGKTCMGIRWRDVLALRRQDELHAVKGTLVMAPEGLKSDFLEIPEELREKGWSKVLSTGSQRYAVGQVVCHNRGELTYEFKFKDKVYRVTREEFVYFSCDSKTEEAIK